MQSDCLKLNCITLVWVYLCNRTDVLSSRITNRGELITINVGIAHFGQLVELLQSSIHNEISSFSAQTNRGDIKPSVSYRVKLVVEVEQIRLQYRGGPPP